MNIPGHLSILCICVASLGYAHAANDQNSQTMKPSAQESGLVAGGADSMIFNQNSNEPEKLSNACATMRTYRVKRREYGSEAVAPAGYTTCVPVRRFEIRSAVETQTDSGAERAAKVPNQ